MQMKTKVLSIFITILALSPTFSVAQEVQNDFQGTFRGKVVEIVSKEEKNIPGTDAKHIYQVIRADVLNGPKEGEVIQIENDYLELKKGQKFYFNYNVYVDGSETYTVTNVDRRSGLIFLVFVFILAVLFFGGWQGLRSLLALAGSFLAIFYVLMPGLVNGWNPLISSSLVASTVLFVAIFFTHGFNRESLVAYAGTMIAVLFTGFFATLAVYITSLTGITADEAVYLNFNTSGTLDFTGLLLGAIIIGVLGVLDDIAVTQAAVVSELYDSNPNISKIEVYRRSIRIGREHVGALVNTLVLAYTGASLPVLMYLKTSDLSFETIINLEVFSTEIVRAIVGSVGLILTVPIVTILSVIYLKGYKSKHSHSHTHIH
jgi:uncharacterized membrane protein